MQKISRESLYTLEKYAERRSEFRKHVLAHKRNRQIAVGPNATLYFEDTTTIQYQVQEILRTERIFEADAINEELEAYNPLIPDGNNLKATFMLEYTDEDERRLRLSKLIGIENRVWIKIGSEKSFAIANEDLERSTEEKTSAVHFLRFQFNPNMLENVRKNSPWSIGVSHPEYQYEVNPVAPIIQQTLSKDLDLT